ncbi:MAG: RNA pseudouridine synthase [Prolixibacteraceae bacterium]|jgi:23S rRNA pseudouridine1911/1915/1917 synthase|nr:RNA pseudouridine synthase [Prolixibacteraceae bacterium]
MQEKKLLILFEDNHLIAINKRCGDIVQGDKTGNSPISEEVKTYLKEKYHKPGNVFLGVTHRLDRPTSGVLLFARTSKSLSRMNELFKNEGEIRKTYWAVVDVKPDPVEATLEHWLVRNEKQNKSFAYRQEQKESKKASLTYRYIASSDRFHLLEIELHTGRHHQIRAQLATIGIHIKGDLKYGFPRSNKDGGIHLHARTIRFVHPVTLEQVIITAPVPNDPVWQFFEKSASVK